MILHQQAEQAFFYIDENGVQAGVLRYRYLSEQKIEVFTTRVDPAFQGKGIAGELYTAMIAFVQEQGLKVKPTCSYIDKKMERSHPELVSW